MVQTGHSRAICSGALNTDVSLLFTADLWGFGMAWDLGIGKGILPFFGHIKGILTREFSMNTYHFATGGNDNFIRVWDTTYFKQYVNITKLSIIGCIRSRNVREKLPAHKRVSDLKFQSN